MTDIVGQCQLPTTAVTTKDTILEPSIQNIIVYATILLFVIVAFTIVIFLIGYKIGFQNGRLQILVDKVTSEAEKVTSDVKKETNEKMTMTVVTYSSVRGMQDGRFEHKPSIGGC